MSETNPNDSLIPLSRASEITGYNQDYLGFLARTGKLDGQKIGRNWVTSISAVNRLLGVEEVGKISVHVVPQPAENSGRAEVLAKLTNLKSQVLTAAAAQAAAPVIAPAPVEQVPAAQPAPDGFVASDLFALKQAAEAARAQSQEQAIRAAVEAKLKQFEADFGEVLQAAVEAALADKVAAEKVSAEKLHAEEAAAPVAFIVPQPAPAAPRSQVTFAKSSPTLPVTSPALQPAPQPSLNLEKIHASFQRAFPVRQYVAATAIAVAAVVIVAGVLGYDAMNGAVNGKIAQLALAPKSQQQPQQQSQQEVAQVSQSAQPQPNVKVVFQYVPGPRGAAGPAGAQGPQGLQGPSGASGSSTVAQQSNASTQVGVFNPSNGLIASPYVPTETSANVPSSANYGPQTISRQRRARSTRSPRTC